MLALLAPGVNMGGGHSAPVVPSRTIPLKDTFAPSRTVTGTSGRAAMKDTCTPSHQVKGG